MFAGGSQRKYGRLPLKNGECEEAHSFRNKRQRRRRYERSKRRPPLGRHQAPMMWLGLRSPFAAPIGVDSVQNLYLPTAQVIFRAYDL